MQDTAPNPYGYFDDERREYVITRPDTPLPWLNYLGQDDFFGLCTQHRRRLHVLEGREAAPAHALPLQQRPYTISAAATST